jgi:CRP-like cAMP-binding protein
VHGAGETILKQWDATLDFYVIVAGRVEIIVDGLPEPIAALADGDFFGELAALDWGAGFGYPRIASVRTVAPTTLLTLPSGSMNEVARDHPPIAELIRSTGLRRLQENQR